jgi:integrase
MSPNFYYDQEDFLRERQAGKDWSFTILRPEAVSGYAIGNPMNLIMAIGVYTAISKELGLPLRFPGPEGAYRALYQITSADILARATVWGGESSSAKDQIYNITNGDYFAGSSCGQDREVVSDGSRGTTHITRMKPVKVQEWLKNMDSAPKTKGHVKAIMHRLYEKAMLWEMVEWQRNPMELVEVKGISKRRKKPIVLTVEQYYLLLALIPQPYRIMVVVAQCTGLRAEEVLALEWQDIDFENLSMKVVRAVVHGRVKIVKTEYSEDELPLDPDFAAVLLDWKMVSEKRAKEEGKTQLTGSDLLFPSTATGRHFHTAPIQQDYIRPAGCCLVACPKCGAAAGVWCRQEGKTPNGGRLPLHEERWEAAGKYDGVGWHTFRHTYRSWLDDTGAPVGVQQKLMRHAQVSTTMNVYGNALMGAKREANSKVVRMALRSA